MSAGVFDMSVTFPLSARYSIAACHGLGCRYTQHRHSSVSSANFRQQVPEPIAIIADVGSFEGFSKCRRFVDIAGFYSTIIGATAKFIS